MLSEFSAEHQRGGVNNDLYVHSPNVNYSQPLNWSAFRANWLLMTTELESEHSDKLLRLAKVRAGSKWVRILYDALRSKASAGFRQKRLETALKEAPDQFASTVSGIAKTMSEGERPQFALDEEPLYLKVKNLTPLFAGVAIDPGAQDPRVEQLRRVQRFQQQEAVRRKKK